MTNLRLSGDTIADIFTGNIRYWDDPEIKKDNPDLDLPHLQIVPVVRSDGAGSRRPTLPSGCLPRSPRPGRLTARRSASRRDCTQTSAYPVWTGPDPQVGQSGDTGVSGYVAQSGSNGAIGYAQFSYAIEDKLPGREGARTRLATTPSQPRGMSRYR